MNLIYEIRRVVKRHQCTEASWHTIEPGTRYLYASCPPWHDGSRSGKKYEVIKACLRCTEQHGLHSSDTRRQLESMIQRGMEPCSDPKGTTSG